MKIVPKTENNDYELEDISEAETPGLKLKKLEDGVGPAPLFVNLPDSEEQTQIKSVELLRISWFKVLLVIPILSVLTILVFPLVLYWKPHMRAKWIY